MITMLKPLTEFHCLCHLFNCIKSFKIINKVKVNTNAQDFIRDVKRDFPTCTFEVENNDKIHIFGHLTKLGNVQNSLLKTIAVSHKSLKEEFKGLDNRHLELIKTILECSSVINLLKKSDLYLKHGRRRFQELRDNLTTLFQLQERNNMILNALIITYAVCEPFVLKAQNLKEFVSRLLKLHNLDKSLNQIKDNMPYKKLLLQEQLKILRIIEQIYSILLELELSGHPEYQL
ncbi:unnamed protein product [Didymodactylos carnosus]|uniref:Uncharacterized protein n=2 Tax=Didymodactylos carnosus TaxID=1234261 RepID=A0A814FMT2_9BILA|nr:unnamed protein product [Didymodactylos carnosus]CAF3757307.1 unnamed protein product [Didymodactylos carnosus]